MDKIDMKKRVAQAVRTLYGGNILTLMVGHVSCRIPDTNNIVMLGHSHKDGKTLDSITENEIIVMDIEGNVIEGDYEAPGEKFIHTEIYKVRPDVNAIVHGHPEMSMVFGVAGVKIVPVFYRADILGTEVPIMDFAGQIDTKELGSAAAKAMGSANALILRGHGNIVTGSSLEEAGTNAFYLETNAKIQYQATLLGNKLNTIKAEEIKHHKPVGVWNYYVKKYDSMY